MLKNKTNWLLPSVVTLALNLGTQAAAQSQAESSDSTERVAISFGAFITDRDTSTRLDSDFGAGTNLDLEDDLGLESSQTVARLDVSWWLGDQRRHRLDFAFFDLSRKATVRLDKEIRFGERSFAINSVVDSDSGITIANVDYTFVILARDRGFFGLGGGLHVTEFSLRLTVSALGTAETGTLTVPLPLFGLRGEYALSNQLTLRGSAQRLAIETDSLKGSFKDFYVGVDYRFQNKFSLGLAYNAVSIDLGARDGQFIGSVDWGYDGLLLFGKYDF